MCRFRSAAMLPVYQLRGTTFQGMRSRSPRAFCSVGYPGSLSRKDWRPEIRLECGRDLSLLSGVVFTAVFSTDKFPRFFQGAPGAAESPP